MRELAQFSEPELRKELSRRRKARKEVKRKAHGEPKRRKGMGCRIGDRDIAAMEARGFLDPGSYIRRDGSEKLVGLDWVARVEELAERSGGRCEHEQPWEVWPLGGPLLERCNYCAVDPQHKVKRSVRRDDRLSNLEHLCRLHHDEKHPEFKTQFSCRVRSGKDGA